MVDGKADVLVGDSGAVGLRSCCPAKKKVETDDSLSVKELSNLSCGSPAANGQNKQTYGADGL